MPTDRESHDMKTNGDIKEKDKDSKRKDICRDFLNNICNRGSRCRFYHPPPDENVEKAQNAADEPYQFCIDFQNQGCHRDNCRYVHAFREDVDRYKRSGDVTLGLARALAALLKGDQINGIPLCKEFQNGHCARGSQCRYWHINREEERRKRFSGRACGGGSPASLATASFGAYLPPAGHLAPAAMTPGARGTRRGHEDFTIDDFGGPATKRPFAQAFAAPMPFAAAPLPPMPVPQQPMSHVVELERRNAELNAEVESLKRELQREKERYDDLMALFRATQGQQQRIVQTQLSGSSSSASLPQQQPGAIQSLGATLAVQQQPSAWANTVAGASAATSAQPNWGNWPSN